MYFINNHESRISLDLEAFYSRGHSMCTFFIEPIMVGGRGGIPFKKLTFDFHLCQDPLNKINDHKMQ